MTRSVDEEILLLRHQVDELIRMVADRDSTEFRPVEWGSLDREQAAEEWQRLTGFVDWLADRYGLSETVPACWYRHPPLLEELSALHAAWLGSYVDPAAPADAGVAWHDNLEKVLHRIREWDRTGCAGGGAHRDDIPLRTDPHRCSDRDTFIHADLANRPDTASDTDGLREGRAPQQLHIVE